MSTPGTDADTVARIATTTTLSPLPISRRASGLMLGLLGLFALGCESAPVSYGRESKIVLSAPAGGPRVWAVAPTNNLSGQPGIDPLLQSDLCFQQLQQVEGITVIPVDRVIQVYAALGIERVQTAQQAALVCDLLGADALLVPTVTAWVPYNPPKMGGSLALFAKPSSYVRPTDIDPRELVRRASPTAGGAALPTPTADGSFQSVGMFDAADGSVRESVLRYAYGRADPLGPFGVKEFFVNSDRYSTFVWRRLTEKLLDQMYSRVGPDGKPVPTGETGQIDAAADREKIGIPDGGHAGPQPFPSNRR